MGAEHDLPIRERLAHWVEHLAHVLPAQAPIRDFVHHNTLHGFQHLPFAEALAAAQALTGARTYWPESRFRQCLAEGRIDKDDLSTVLDEAGVDGLDTPLVRGLTRRDVLLASLMAGDDGVEANRLDWLRRETGLDDDALFACCSKLTSGPAQSPAEHGAGPATAWAALVDQVGRQRSWRSVLATLTGEDVLERVRAILQRHLAAHLDLGVAAWRNPARAQGFFAAWRASAGLDLAWEMDELPNVRDEILHLPDQPLDVLVDELPRLLSDQSLWSGYLERLSLELPGWSGMFLWRERNPARGDGTPVAMLDYLAVRVLLERLLLDDLVRRLVGWPMGLTELREHFLARPQELAVRLAVADARLPEDLQGEAANLVERARSGHVDELAWQHLAERLEPVMQAREQDDRAWQLTACCRQLGLMPADVEVLGAVGLAAMQACMASLTALQRGQIWLLAYERHYREQIFGALAANHGRHCSPVQPAAQVVMCMDDREEGTRRHLEEIAPQVATYGAAGFFGVPMYWQGLDDAEKSALCPVVVQPRHLIREWPADGAGALAARHAARRERRLRWRERFFQTTRRRALAGPLLTALGSLPALAALTAATVAPGWFGASLRRWREQYEGRVSTRLGLTADEVGVATPEQPQMGWSVDAQVGQLAAFLRMIGLVADFAPLVLLFGHGSDSRNNPHLSAYDCGACAGKHGGPNARVFAALANRPEVRAGLIDRGLVICDDTWFVAAEHNTCDDGVEWYDLDRVPPRFQPALDALVGQIGEACRAHAAERCRRLASAPTRPSPWQARRHVVGRAHDIAQARPELGHATNAAAFIGRRQMSRGLFLDRRVFLISYDPTADDADGRIVESILLAAGPVGAGIALEYYFSSVDNERFGCGSKITHNVTGLFGVMEGADSDLRTGLPWQMVEIHEPMRLLVVVEQTTEVLSAIVQRQAALHELIVNAWIVVAAKDPISGAIQHYCPRRGWLPWSGSTVLPQVGRSVDWFAGESAPLAPALILGGAP
ncbi:DUF2309 domain-containing protein [Dechloromonas sp. XY25]|uniref:Probable inorganic carbon transporter subunit DabA n=1 Tax=Dechloromonas hankyongensis TaxID=2908002 RepID=A0ABS9K5N9_9RHOO|nr:DUF2309 domain-containing protein [Dechloromonas hankyongensis]MCG2578497.1 DUF2309 domain-containing protein [Dechloromonas hankyongensis]